MSDMTRLRDLLVHDFAYRYNWMAYMAFQSEIHADRNNIEQNIMYVARKYKLSRVHILHTLKLLVKVKALAVFNIDGVNCYAIHPHGPVVTDEMVEKAKLNKIKAENYLKRITKNMEEQAEPAIKKAPLKDELRPMDDYMQPVIESMEGAA